MSMQEPASCIFYPSGVDSCGTGFILWGTQLLGKACATWIGIVFSEKGILSTCQDLPKSYIWKKVEKP